MLTINPFHVFLVSVAFMLMFLVRREPPQGFL